MPEQEKPSDYPYKVVGPWTKGSSGFHSSLTRNVPFRLHLWPYWTAREWTKPIKWDIPWVAAPADELEIARATPEIKQGYF